LLNPGLPLAVWRRVVDPQRASLLVDRSYPGYFIESVTVAITGNLVVDKNVYSFFSLSTIALSQQVLLPLERLDDSR
jgi:hypothetical protein